MRCWAVKTCIKVHLSAVRGIVGRRCIGNFRPTLHFVPTGGNVGRVDMTGRSREDTANLTGTWHGQFTYSRYCKPVFFVATLVESAGSIDGTTHEPRPGTGETINAIIGRCRSANAVTFVKTYQNAPRGYNVVSYAGKLSGDGPEIEGSWQITRDRSGKFLMIRTSGIEQSFLAPGKCRRAASHSP